MSDRYYLFIFLESLKSGKKFDQKIQRLYHIEKKTSTAVRSGLEDDDIY